MSRLLQFTVCPAKLVFSYGGGYAWQVRGLEKTVKTLVKSQKALVKSSKQTAEQRPAIIIASAEVTETPYSFCVVRSSGQAYECMRRTSWNATQNRVIRSRKCPYRQTYEHARDHQCAHSFCMLILAQPHGQQGRMGELERGGDDRQEGERQGEPSIDRQIQMNRDDWQVGFSCC